MTTCNKNHLIDDISKTEKVTRTEAERWIRGVLSAFSRQLGAGNNIMLVGFGTLKLHHRPASERANPLAHINPKAPKKVVSKAKNVIKFKAGTKLNEIINKSGKAHSKAKK